MLAHRGPDAAGAYADEDTVLAARRLRVVDPRSASDQPISSADGRFVLVFNGEIYNRAELGVPDGGDGSALVEHFARTGPEGLADLRGMYAFAVWDREARELFAARDPFGIKPLFLAESDGLLRFASEKKALATAGSELDRDALGRYLAFGFPAPGETLTAGVRALQPGQTLRAGPRRAVELSSPRGVTLRRRRRAAAPTPQRVQAALRDSVRAHLHSDVPVGALLSGGVDSAAICALAAEQIPALPTFTVGFEREGFSEVDHALATAEALGLPCTPRIVSAAEFVAALPEIVWHLDDPLADAAAVPLWFVAREARRQVTVVLSGEGADELFAGYHNYREPQRVDGTPAVPHHYIGAEHIWIGDEIAGIARGTTGRAADVTAAIHGRARAAGLDPVTTMQQVDLLTWLPGDILVKADRMSMAHGLELRVPFLDRAVLAVAAELGPGDKVGATTKLALRRAVEGLLPPAVVRRPKLGFPVPIGHWLRGELADWAHDVVSAAEVEPYLRRGVALDLLARYRAGEEFDWRRAWALVIFCLWHQVHVEARFSPPATC